MARQEVIGWVANPGLPGDNARCPLPIEHDQIGVDAGSVPMAARSRSRSPVATDSNSVGNS